MRNATINFLGILFSYVRLTIPYAFQKCKETGRIDNFIFAGGIKEGKFQGNYGFNDSDLYKIMEGAAFVLMIKEDPALRAYLDSLVYYVSEAQEEDGYLYTAKTLNANDYTDFHCCTYSDQGRWIETPNSSHEFYNAGRSPWFSCSCCPSNLSRFIPSVAGYAYATRGKELLN